MKWAQNAWIQGYRTGFYSSPVPCLDKVIPTPPADGAWAHTTPAWEHLSKQAQAWFCAQYAQTQYGCVYTNQMYWTLGSTVPWVGLECQTSLEKVYKLELQHVFPSSPKLSVYSGFFAPHACTFTLGEAWPLSIAIAAPAEFKRASLLWINVALISPPPHAPR